MALPRSDDSVRLVWPLAVCVGALAAAVLSHYTMATLVGYGSGQARAAIGDVKTGIALVVVLTLANVLGWKTKRVYEANLWLAVGGALVNFNLSPDSSILLRIVSQRFWQGSGVDVPSFTNALSLVSYWLLLALINALLFRIYLRRTGPRP
ncbi:MAG: hypothetical protein HY248_03575 [Fimbriimonas ginsengisoli]|uniref:Uncharacterized protein n=1 Tax=Fimbriimonas ginsengisoli TaxID=1005039 RepID=A0A931LXM6_FIMGI|nr:hypothetical protein [Fimbriimonas ginsengisoli]MBI3721610.1 hypothetical protein [Fimbriimonas ginsengisoli]